MHSVLGLPPFTGCGLDEWSVR